MVKVKNARAIVGSETTTPYLTKSTNLKLTSFSFKICNHMIPAREPSGVSIVVKFELMLVAKLAINEALAGSVVITDDINTLIGMLLIRLPIKKENIP